MPEEVDRCVESVLEDNPEMDESRAWAICHAQIEGGGDAEDVTRRDVLAAMTADQKQDDPARICGDIWFNGTSEQRDAFGAGTDGRGTDELPPEAWWTDCINTVSQSTSTSTSTSASTPAAGGKSVTAVGEQAPIIGKAVPDVDPDAAPEEFADALQADKFVIYGKASIEKLDVGGENSDIREVLDMEALDGALDRFFESEKAPGIISLGHDDLPVGRPIEEYTLDEDTVIEIDGDTYEFGTGETLRTEAKETDGDGRPELWMLADLANDTDISRKARLGVLLGEIDGFSVTIGRKATAPEPGGRRVTELDLFAVTLAPSDMIANKGSEFDLAAFKARLPDFGSNTDDVGKRTSNPAEELIHTVQDAIMSTTDDDDTTTTKAPNIFRRAADALSGKAEELEDQAGADADPAEDEGQKQPEGGSRDPDDQEVEEDLIAALAEQIDEQPQKLREAIDQLASDDEMDDDDDDEDDDEEQKADADAPGDGDDDTDASAVSFDFEAKADEHGFVTEDELESKLDEHRETIVEDVGEKLAEANEEALDEVAQKLAAGDTPSPAGGSFQDEQDFEDEIKEIADSEGWS